MWSFTSLKEAESEFDEMEMIWWIHSFFGLLTDYREFMKKCGIVGILIINLGHYKCLPIFAVLIYKKI
jgi:hypothetical protein